MAFTDFPVIKRTHYVSTAETLDFAVSDAKKMQVYKQFDVYLVSPGCNFNKNETPGHLPSCKIW